jgi:hypothetical protein
MYFENRCFDAMAWLIELLDAKLSLRGEDLAAELRELLEQSQTPIESGDDAAYRVLQALASSLENAGAATGEFAGSVTVSRGYDRGWMKSGFRYIQAENLSEELRSHGYLGSSFSHLDVAIVTNVGVAMRHEAQMEVFIPLATDHRHAVRIVTDAQVADIYLRLEDISPDLSAAAELRIDTYASQVFSRTLARLVEEARSVLLEHGRARLDIERAPRAGLGDEA